MTNKCYQAGFLDGTPVQDEKKNHSPRHQDRTTEMDVPCRMKVTTLPGRIRRCAPGKMLEKMLPGWMMKTVFIGRMLEIVL